MTNVVYVLNGPNLNLLGSRENSIYGKMTLADIEKLCADTAKKHGLGVDCRQTNHEGALVDWIQEARTKAAGIVINPGAYTHTSVALQDAIRATSLPVIEVHLSNIFTREEFRHHSYVSPVAHGVICGFGGDGYALAIDGLAAALRA